MKKADTFGKDLHPCLVITLQQIIIKLNSQAFSPFSAMFSKGLFLKTEW